MAKLYSSTTADPEYSLFFGAREQAQFNWWNTELLEIVAQQHINYWPIEKDESDVDDLYGESEQKVTRNPIKVYAWVMLEEPEVRTGQFGTDRIRRIEVYAHRDRLTEVGIVPRVGDYIEWDNDYFEIHYADVPLFVAGLEETKISVLMRASSVREGVFSPKIQGSDDERIPANSSYPY